MKDQPAGSPPGRLAAGVTGVGPGVAQRGGEGAGAESLAGAGRAEPAVQGQHQQPGGAVIHLGHAGHDARGAERQQRAGQAEQLVGAGRASSPESQLGRMSRNGARRSRSRSCTVIGPSSSRSEENIGLSARKVPCAAICASPAPSIAESTRAVVADPPASTMGGAAGGRGGVVSPQGGPGGWVPPEKEPAEPDRVSAS